MRIIENNAIATAVEKMCREANCVLPQDTEQALGKALKLERSPLGRDILEQCLLNAKIAKAQKIPVCQDTGLAVFFVKQGKDVEIKGGPLPDAINKGVAQRLSPGFPAGLLRGRSGLFPQEHGQQCSGHHTHRAGSRQQAGDKLHAQGRRGREHQPAGHAKTFGRRAGDHLLRVPSRDPGRGQPLSPDGGGSGDRREF